MIFTILIIVFVLIGLLVLHELGHFVLAKKFGVKVEEFGIGIPPKIIGKKIGETVYSINLLPLGAFVKLAGEDEKNNDPRSFSQKPISQRALIVLGGVISFWLISFIIFTLVAGVWGLPEQVSDEFQGPANVQIIGIAENSPAEMNGVKLGDKIIGFKFANQQIKIDKVKEVQTFIKEHSGEEIVLMIQRGEDILSINLIPRKTPPKEQGAIGVSLARIVHSKANWYEAPIKGAEITIKKTIQIPIFLGFLFKKALRGEKVEGIEMVGPIGIGSIMGQALKLGIDSFLIIIAMISISLAVINIMPIPAVDGGRLLFLGIEAIRKKPISQPFEQKINAISFFVLIFLMIFVSIKDIVKLF